MATDPFRLRVMKAVTDTLKTISPANGYINDLTDTTDAVGRPQLRVFRGRTIFGKDDPLPMLSVLENPNSLEPNNGIHGSTQAANQFRIIIQGFVPDDAENPLDPAYVLSAEVITALVKQKRDRFNILGLGKGTPSVINMSIGQPVHRPADDEISNVTYFAVGITLALAEDLETPFA